MLAGLAVPAEVKSTSTAPLVQASLAGSAGQPFWSVGSEAKAVFGGITEASSVTSAAGHRDKTKESADMAKEAEFDSFMASIGVQRKP